MWAAYPSITVRSFCKPNHVLWWCTWGKLWLSPAPGELQSVSVTGSQSPSPRSFTSRAQGGVCWAWPPEFLTQQGWDGARECALLASSHVMLMLLTLGPPISDTRQPFLSPVHDLSSWGAYSTTSSTKPGGQISWGLWKDFFVTKKSQDILAYFLLFLLLTFVDFIWCLPRMWAHVFGGVNLKE